MLAARGGWSADQLPSSMPPPPHRPPKIDRSSPSRATRPKARLSPTTSKCRRPQSAAARTIPSTRESGWKSGAEPEALPPDVRSGAPSARIGESSNPTDRPATTFSRNACSASAPPSTGVGDALGERRQTLVPRREAGQFCAGVVLHRKAHAAGPPDPVFPPHLPARCARSQKNAHQETRRREVLPPPRAPRARRPTVRPPPLAPGDPRIRAAGDEIRRPRRSTRPWKTGTGPRRSRARRGRCPRACPSGGSA